MQQRRSSRNSFGLAKKSGGFKYNGRSQSVRSPRRGGPKKDFIDHNMFIKKAKPVAETVYTPQHTFADFDIAEIIKNNLKRKNYINPTPIQDRSIPEILAGHDIIGLANTGTGKTAAFLLPLINKVMIDKTQRVLIVAPTRELAQQIENEFFQFSFGTKIQFATCVGGMPIYKQINALRRNPHFIIGTPGRIKDLGDRGLIGFDKINNVVLDEVDRMLDMGFVDEIRAFLAKLPTKRQSLFFSATMPPKIRALAESFLVDPITVEVASGKTTDNVEQDIIKFYNENYKFDQLSEILKDPKLSRVLIFNETKRDVEKLSEGLNSAGIKSESIHGDKRQGQRTKALNAFKNGHVRVLVATDVAARGLDIKEITHVINYTLPNNYDDYIHRIGRTGRGGSIGKALTFVKV
jgi:superfamily II DNA/RNA helicase